jgi:hypothetical protein
LEDPKRFPLPAATMIADTLLMKKPALFYKPIQNSSSLIAQVSRFKNTQLLPQRGKSCSVSGFALLALRARNRARSAFKRFFHLLTFA